MSSKKHARGFTLVELLIVISIIALLLGILLPALRRAKDQAKAARCLSNLKQIGLAAHLYAHDNDNLVPRDETDGLWSVLFMPYVGGLSDKIQHYSEVKIYDCPSYPVKEQTVDYCINAWDIKSGNTTGQEQRGATKLNNFPRHASTIYLADYEYNPNASHIKIILKGDNPATLQEKLRWLDVWHKNHLPSSDAGRRVARDRHVNHINCLFVDAHSGKMNPLEITPHDYGLPGYGSP